MRATWAVVVAGVLGAVPAKGDDKATCAAAYKSAQDLQEKSSLLEAREQLKICARPTCAEFVVKDCTVWLEGVQKKIPSVIFVAEPAKGDKLSTKSRSALLNDAAKLRRAFKDTDVKKYLLTFWYGPKTSWEKDLQDARDASKGIGLTFVKSERFATRLRDNQDGYFALCLLEV